MENWLNHGARMGAVLQERDRHMGELVAAELLITKHNRLGNQEMVDVLLDTLAANKKELKVIDEIIEEWFGCDVSELRAKAIELRTALDTHEEVMANLSEVERTLEILVVGQAFNEETSSARDVLLQKRDFLKAQLKHSAKLLDEFVAGAKDSEDTADETSEVELNED